MPRFYFDVREGSRFAPDDEGMEFPDLAAAEREAAEAAAGIARDLLPKGDAHVAVAVRTGSSRPAVTVKVSIEVERAVPSPAPRQVR